MRDTIKLVSTESDHFYTTKKNKRTTPDKLKRKKFDPTPGVRRHVLYEEAKIK